MFTGLIYQRCQLHWPFKMGCWGPQWKGKKQGIEIVAYKPTRMRADNKIIFASWVFPTFLKLIGVRHQRIKTCPAKPLLKSDGLSAAGSGTTLCWKLLKSRAIRR